MFEDVGACTQRPTVDELKVELLENPDHEGVEARNHQVEQRASVVELGFEGRVLKRRADLQYGFQSYRDPSERRLVGMG